MVARVLPDSPAAKAGIQPNDLIVGINGQPLYHINGIDDFLRENPSTPIQLNLKRNGADVTVPFEPGRSSWGGVTGKSGGASGFEKGRRCSRGGSAPMKSTAAVSEYIRHHGGQPVVFSVLRDGKKVDLNVTPEVPQGDTIPAHRYFLGRQLWNCPRYLWKINARTSDTTGTNPRRDHVDLSIPSAPLPRRSRM